MPRPCRSRDDLKRRQFASMTSNGLHCLQVKDAGSNIKGAAGDVKDKAKDLIGKGYDPVQLLACVGG